MSSATWCTWAFFDGLCAAILARRPARLTCTCAIVVANLTPSLSPLNSRNARLGQQLLDPRKVLATRSSCST